MYYKFSKLAKTVIIINVVLTILIVITHGYNIHRLRASNEIIDQVMVEKSVIRETAIRMLKRDGVRLYIDKELSAYFGIFVSILTLFLLYNYAKNNGFFFGFFAAFFAVFTSLIGGMLLFYVILSGKSEVIKGESRYSIKNEWQKYIHNRSEEI